MLRTEGEEDDDWVDLKVLPKEARLLLKRKYMDRWMAYTGVNREMDGIHGC